MTLLVISDSHGRVGRIEQALSLNPECEAILFLGDGLRDLERAELLGKPVVAVRGNCDTLSLREGDDERIVRFGEYNIMLIHGHTLGVKHSLVNAISHAARRDVDILLYGHTHLRHDEYIPAGENIYGIELKKPLRIFNPGSLGEPRDSAPSFGLIGIRGKDVLTSHGVL